ncbi:MAG TPA: hypothetical protein VGY90_02210 [Steroidobacteraceae bacterium]|jgi:hypothetical protein|nr:hypothetical protein [Steroidobacteraceae bacterium]
MTDPAQSDPAQDEARRRRQKIQRQLDEALAASFPASDPVSIVTSHEEEDWGDNETPSPPAKPTPPAGG